MTVRIILEGPRACGKSFLARVIANFLRRKGYDVSVLSSVTEYDVPEDVKGVGKVIIQERWGPSE